MNVDIDEHQPSLDDENIARINWAPTINAHIPETFEFPQESKENLTAEQEIFIREIRELIDETRIAALCCELVLSNVLFNTKTINFNFLEFLRCCILAFIDPSYRFETLYTSHSSSKRK